MNVNDPGDPLLPPPVTGHHRSARERQRKGPMWGCLKALFWIILGTFVILFIGVGGGWWYLGSASFADYVRKKVETTLETRLGRDVTIREVVFVRSRPQKVILRDIRIANAPGAVNPHFATVREVEITGGVQSFWSRNVDIDRVDIRDPRLFFEVFPQGSPLQHNFPQWKSAPRGRFQIVHVELNDLFVTGGQFDFNDRRHDIHAVSTNIAAKVTVTAAENLYAGIMNSPLVRVRLQDYEPFDVDMRGGFRFTPGKLALQSVALKGRGIEAFVSGNLDPLSEAVYDLRLRARVGLPRIAEIFRVQQKLEGDLALDTNLRGKSGDFNLTGAWASPSITADAYTLDDVKGKLNVTDERLVLDVDTARYGGGTIGAHYVLSKFADPYPMTVDLRYNGIAIEQLFNDWTVQNTGLRGAATGQLSYRWNKDKVLEGSGDGTARLAQNTVAFSDAQYPIPVGGKIDYALDNGVVRFKSAELDTAASHISLTGTLRIEDLFTDLKMAIRSSDFSELDRIGFNFAHSADKKDYELLGLGGAGTIDGTVKGTIKEPQVAAQINATALRYNEVLLGDSDIALRYDGARSTLVFDRAVFTDRGGRLVLTGNIVFPDSGPGPRFDIAVEASGYPAQRAIDAVGLDFKIGEGLATGRMVVTGTPDSGRVTFAGLTVKRGDAELRLAGDVQWAPGDGDVRFDLDVAARDFPVADLMTFFDFGTFPVTGTLTGELRISGPKQALEGSGRVTVRQGSVFGEPVDLASADIVFDQGRLRATNVLVQAPAGEIRGEAEIDLATERFSYTIASSSLDLSRFQLLAALKDLLGGTITLRSTGAGTFDQPELVVEATLEGATLRGLSLPEGFPPPSLYIAIRNGRLVVRGSIADIVSIEGEGAVGENNSVDGLVRITITDLARLALISPKTATIPVKGSVIVDMKLGGRLSPIEALVVDATFPTFDVSIADQPFAAPRPLHVALRNGRIEFLDFELARTDSSFSVSGFAEITGAKRIDIDVRGRVDAALAQLLTADVRAEGFVDVAASVDGTLSAPIINGTAELRDAQVKFAGFPQLIDDINGTLRFRGDRIEIESVRATVGGGTIAAGGFVTVEGFAPKTARITLRGTDVALRYYEGLTIESNFDLLLSGDLDRALLQGDVDVTRALWFREFDIQQTLLDVVLARRSITPVATATWQDRVGLRVNLSAPGTLAVRNNLAEVTGSAELDVTGTVANPIVLGEVTLDEGGTVRVQNVDYRVVRGTIAFQNPFRIDPFFDVTIEGTVSGGLSEIESGPLDVTVNITGTLDRITPTITSDPPASDITLFSILGFGGLAGGRSGQGGTSASLAGQSLLYQSLFSALGQRVFPFVDSFTFDPGLLDTGGSGQKVSFEKRLSNNVRFLLVYNIDNAKSKQVVEWTINRDWTLQLTRDESDEYRVEARFRRRYDAHWTWGDRGRGGSLAPFGIVDAEGQATQRPIAPAPPTTTVQPRAVDGQNITQVNFRADANVDTSTLGQYVTLRPGQPVTIRELQSSIKNLFATGNYRDVRVDAAPAEGGVVLTFALFLNYRVADVDFEGIRGGDRTRAERALQFRTGEVLSLNAVDDSATSIREELERLGYLEATVDPETTFDRARSSANVTFHVTPGPQATIGEVLITGDTAPFTTAELIGRMRRGPGRTFRLVDARGDAERIKNFLVRRDHRRADVDFQGQTYDAERNSVTLRYNVVVGPKVRVEVTGIDRKAVRRWLPFDRNQEYSEDTIERAADEITTGLQQRGYFNATVDTESRVDTATNTWVTTFDVHPGERYRLADVTFSGNIKVPDKELRGVVATSTRGGVRRIVAALFRRPTGMTREQLSDDQESLESYYRLQGFSEATAGTPVVATRADGTMTVDFPVNEGPQTLVASVQVEGTGQVDADDLPARQLEPGAPLNPQVLHDDVVAIQTFYAERGNVEVQVAPRVDVSEDKSSAVVTYVITEGPEIKVDEVIVRGNTYTDSEVILRKSDIEKGDPFSYTSILGAQRDLYRLGIFSRVEIQPEQTGTTVGDRDIVIQVEEGRNLTLSGSVGARAQRPSVTSDSGYDISPRVALAAAHRNLFGTGRYLGMEGVVSDKEEELYITYREPYISRWNVPVQLQIFQTDDDTRPGAHIQQRGTSIEAIKVARLQTRWSLRYEYKISDCIDGEICLSIRDPEEDGDDDDDEPVPIPGLDRSLLNIQISSITPTFFWDRRDDIVDPHRGFFTSASVEYAFPLFSAEANFLKEYLQGAYYFPLSERTVIAVSGRLGLIQPLGDTEHKDVPLSERFTSGGETTHRGFELDLLGTLCQDDRDFDKDGICEQTLFQEFNFDTGEFEGPILPLGGSGLLLLNAEYRFPVFGPVGGAVFADVGQVYRTSTIDLSKLRYGTGLGIRYLSPVGPLRIDIGWPLDRRLTERSFNYFITLGYAF